MWYQHMIPSMKSDLLGSDVMGATLQPLFFMIENATDDEYNNILFNEIRNILNIPRSVQASVTLLENIDLLVRRSSRDQVVSTLLPVVISSLDSSMPQIQVSRILCSISTYTHTGDLVSRHTHCTLHTIKCSVTNETEKVKDNERIKERKRDKEKEKIRRCSSIAQNHAYHRITRIFLLTFYLFLLRYLVI